MLCEILAKNNLTLYMVKGFSKNDAYINWMNKLFKPLVPGVHKKVTHT